MTDREQTLCSCGHPKEAHPPSRNEHGTLRLFPCRATKYRRSEHGDDAWPCPCQRFTEATE